MDSSTSIFAKQYELYQSGQKLGDTALNMARVYFPSACPDEPPEFHRVLLHWYFSDYEQTAAAAPRGHAKSTMCSQIGVLCDIAFRLHHNILICSETLTQAVDLLSAIKNELEHNTQFQEDFGIDMQDGKEAWNQEYIQLRLRDGFQIRVTAKSSGSSMRGTKFHNWRPSRVLLDDIEGEENVSTAEQRDKLHTWLLSVLVPAMDPKNTRVRFVGTVLHEDSLLNKSLKSKTWFPVVFKAHNRTFTKILWPSRFTRDKLRKLRDEFERQGKMHLYYKEYLNTVIPEGGSFFTTDKIEYVDSIPLSANRYTACDLAISEKSHADYTVIATIAAQDGIMYIEDIKRGRFDAFGIVAEMIRTERQFRPVTFTIEKGSIEKAIKPYLELEEQKNGVYLAKRFVAAVNDKKTRARGLQGLITSGRVKILRGIEFIAELIEELDKFGSTTHDDIVDALSYCCYELQSKLREEQEEKVAEILGAKYEEDLANFFGPSRAESEWSAGDGWGD